MATEIEIIPARIPFVYELALVGKRRDSFMENWWIGIGSRSRVEKKAKKIIRKMENDWQSWTVTSDKIEVSKVPYSRHAVRPDL